MLIKYGWVIVIGLSLILSFPTSCFSLLLGGGLDFSGEIPSPRSSPNVGDSNTVVIVNADSFSTELTGGVSHGQFVANKEIQKFIQIYQTNPKCKDTRLMVITAQGQVIADYGNKEGKKKIILLAMDIKAEKETGEINFTLNDVIDTTVTGIQLAKQISGNVVVNWSLGAGDDSSVNRNSFSRLSREVIDKYPDVVFVASAAKTYKVDPNTGRILDSKDIDEDTEYEWKLLPNYPGKFAEYKNNVISVGSPGYGGAEFDSTTVLANGSSVITKKEGRRVRATGNSFAAPEVTMTVALSWLQNSQLTPGDLKDIITEPALQATGQNHLMLNANASINLSGSRAPSPISRVTPQIPSFDFFGFIW